MVVVSSVKTQLDELCRQVGETLAMKQGDISAGVMDVFFTIGKIAEKIATYGEPAVPDLIDYAQKCGIIDHRLCIMAALGKIGSHAASRFLTGCLGSEEALERSYAANALADLKDASVLSDLKVAFEKETKMRPDLLNAISVLEPYNPDLDVYLPALEDDDPQVRRQAIQAIRHLPGLNVREKLMDALHDPQMGVVYDAVRGLKPLGAAIVDPLLAKLTAKGRYTRSVATELLGDIKDPRAIEPLCHQLRESKNKALRAQIATSLGKIKSTDAVSDLCRALQDSAAEVREAAATALGRIAAAEAVPDLSASLEAGYTFDGREKEYATVALGKIGSPKAVAALTAALKNDSVDVRMEAVKGLLKNKATQALAPMKKALEKEGRDVARKKMETAIYKLAQLKAKQAGKTRKDKAAKPSKGSKGIDFPAAIAMLADEVPANRKKAITVVARAGQRDVVDDLAALLYDADGSVRKKAAEAIKSLSPDKIVDNLHQKLPAADGTRLPYLIEALGILGDPETPPLLMPFLESEEAHIRKKAKTALKRLHGDEDLIRHRELLFKIQTHLSRRKLKPVVAMGDKAISPLRELLVKTGHADTQRFAAAALDELNWQPEETAERVHFHLYRSHQDVFDEQAVEGFEALEELLFSGLYPGEAAKVAKALACAGGRATDLLVSGLLSRDYRVRDAVVQVLTETGLADTDSIVAQLDGDDADTVASAVQLLAQLDAVEAVPRLIDMLRAECGKEDNRNDQPGFAIARALGQLKDKKAVPVLVEALRLPYAWNRGAAIALGELNAKEAIPALVYAWKNEEGSLKAQAHAALKKMGWEED